MYTRILYKQASKAPSLPVLNLLLHFGRIRVCKLRGGEDHADHEVSVNIEHVSYAVFWYLHLLYDLFCGELPSAGTTPIRFLGFLQKEKRNKIILIGTNRAILVRDVNDGKEQSVVTRKCLKCDTF
jgi:hypothetical protein